MIRILFVDDEQSVLDGLKRTLRPLRKQWEPAFAGGGPKALELLGSTPFDAVVTDMRMPGMDGLALLKQVAVTYPSLLRVVLSGQSESEKLVKAENAAHHYLAKPCPLDVLQSTVDRAFSLRQFFARPALQALVARIEWDRPPRYWVEAEGRGEPRHTQRGTYAKRIVRRLMASSGELHDQAHLAGTLLEVGQTALRHYLPCEIVPDAAAELAAYILAQAGLPDVIVEAVAYHQAPALCPDRDNPLLLAVHVAYVLALGSPEPEAALDLAFLNAIGQVTDLAEWRTVAIGPVN